MKTTRWGCRSLRDGLMVAAVFQASAVLLMLIGWFLVPDMAGFRELTFALGLLLMLFVPLVLTMAWMRHGHHTNTRGHML